MLHLGNVVDPVQHPSGNKPLNRFLKIPAHEPPSRTAPYINFSFGFASWDDNAAEHHQNPSAVDLAVVLREVVLIDLNEFTLDLRIFAGSLYFTQEATHSGIPPMMR